MLKKFLPSTLLLIFVISAYSLNNQPVIGILSQPSPFSPNGFPAANYSYIAGSYVDFIEGAGGRVVPIQWDTPLNQIDALLDQINGVIFPGGASGIAQSNYQPTLYGAVGQHIVDKVFQYNRKGDYFPIWGTCLGFELLTSAVAQNFSILTHMNASNNVARTINITSYGYQSRLYANFPPDLIQKIQSENITFFHHQYTPDPLLFFFNQNLLSNITITATTRDAIDGFYVASYEGNQYPIYGTQFHAEKNTYEWYAEEVIPHGLDPTRMEQAYAQFFVNETRKSNHKFTNNTAWLQASIYNYNPFHFGVDPEFEATYIIPNYNFTHGLGEIKWDGPLFFNYYEDLTEVSLTFLTETEDGDVQVPALDDKNLDTTERKFFGIETLDSISDKL